MISKRIIALNTVWLSTTEVIARLMSFFLVMVVARKLGPDMMGIYAFGAAFVGLFEIFVNFGLEPYVQREVGRHPELAGPLFSRITVLKLIISLAGFLAVSLAAVLITDSLLKRQVLWILGLSLFFKGCQGTANAFFRALQQSRYEAVVRLSLRFTYAVSGSIAVLNGGGLILLVSLELAAHMLACFLGWRFFARNIARPFHPVTWENLRQLAGAAKEFLFIRIVNIIFESFDQVMLSFMAGNIAVGLYASSYRLISAFDFFPSSFTGAFMPVLSRAGVNDKADFIDVFRIYYRYLLMLGLGLAAILGGLSRKIILLVFGSDFIAASPTLMILAICLVFTFVNWSLSSAIIALDKERQMLIVFSISAFVNIVANLFLIPYMKQDGAAWATLVSQIVLFSLQLWIAGLPLLMELKLFQLSARPVAAGFLTTGLALFLNGMQLHLAAVLTLAGVAYLAFLLISGALSYREILTLKSLFQTKREAP